MSKVERVVVLKGMDAITALGNTLEETWGAIIAGKSGIRPIEPKELADPRVKIAAQVDIDLAEHIAVDERAAFHRSHAFSVVTSRRVFRNALLEKAKPEEIGILIGTGMGGGASIADIKEFIMEDRVEELDPMTVQRLLGSRVGTSVSADLGTTGSADTHDAACATGNRTISLGYTMLSHPTAYRKLKVMLVGGSEAAITPEGLAAFASAEMLSTRNKYPEKACCPYDEEEANGFVMGEGDAVLPIALESFALEHNLPILAVIAGFGNSSDRRKDMFFPDAEGELMAMEEACEMAKIKPSQIDYINGHGPGTGGDRAELEAILRLKAINASLSSTKAAIGHMLGAAAAIEAQMCIMAILTGTIPPTLNLRNPMLRGIDYVALQARQKRVRVAMNNSFGLNGINSVVLFEEYRRKTARTFPVTKAA